MRAVSRRGVTAWELTSAQNQVNWTNESQVNWPETAATSTRIETRPIALGFHCNIRLYLPTKTADVTILPCGLPGANPSIGGFAERASGNGVEASFSERLAGPRETFCIPPREARDRDAVTG